MAMKRMDVEFNKHGLIHSPAEVAALLDGLSDATDLLVVSHGWNNDIADARALYNELLGNVDELLDAREHPSVALGPLKGRTFAACQVFWPSKKFADADLIPGGGAASAAAVAANDGALGKILEELAHDPNRLGERKASGVRERIVEKAKTLVDKLDGDLGAQREFVFALRSLLDPEHASAEDGSDDFFTVEPETLFKDMDVAVVAPRPAAGGGATALRGEGGAASLGDLITGAKAAARRLANYATYYKMKSRAGTVGTVGLASVLRQVRQRHPNLKLHLVGHSFGGRLITAAANALDDNTPAVTMSLLQAAFSHNGLSEDFDKGKAGFFREVLSKKRVSGPIIITHTKNDVAVGVAYPLASRVARQNASAFGDANDPYGGMGRNGAQRTAEAKGNATSLAGVGHKYSFATNKIYNLLADKFIKDHGDVSGAQTAYAVLSAASAV